jgi:hypothetical protein
MHLIARFFVILFALIVASIAAGAVVVLAVLLPEWSDLALGALEQGTLGIVVGFGAIFLSGFALVPMLLVVLIAEAFGIRSALFYALAGAASGFVVYWSLGGLDPAMLTVNGFTRREAEIMAAAGTVAGLVYWMIAGRRAGAWRGRARLPEQA